MTIEIKVPVLPESVADATVSKWYKKVGDTIERDENLVDLETDKVMLEVPAPKGGVIQSIAAPEGSVVTANQILAILIDAAAQAAPVETPKVAPQPVAQPVSQPAQKVMAQQNSTPQVAQQATQVPAGPAARREAAEHSVDVNTIPGSGKDGRVTKTDVEQAVSLPPKPKPVAVQMVPAAMPTAAVAAPVVSAPTTTPAALLTQTSVAESVVIAGNRSEKRVPMSRLRARIAERLLESQHNAAILTTFNEINMQPVMELRARYKDLFEKQYGVRLGFMSFFVKAAVEALKRFPEVNAYIDGNDVIYHDFMDIGIAIGSPRGLVVPILRNAEVMAMADIEIAIRDYSEKARQGKLTMEDMTGGTFTISNGGTYGSMMSTPIINPPQSGILGMHKISERAMVENGEIVIRSMMYVALSYDHRIIDGSQSVRFLVTIKEMLEDPSRLILQI